MKSFVKVNSIMQGSVPTMFVNGHPGMDNIAWTWRTRIYEEMRRQGVRLPVFMNEFYFIKDGHGCLPDTDLYGGIVPDQLPVDSSSDGDYIVAEVCGTIEGPYGPQTRYTGHQSLQSAIDGGVYGWLPLYAIGGILTGPTDTLYVKESGLLQQCQQVHEPHHGNKFWAMLQADDDDNRITPNGCCPIRVPTPNEVKLSAWLAMACDVDGILWYPVNFASGLLKWDPDSADMCLGLPQGLAAGPARADTTDRFAAAKKVGRDIKRIAPILESLEFVKTYASRAFEHNYGYDGNVATQRDTLATPASWYFG